MRDSNPGSSALVADALPLGQRGGSVAEGGNARLCTPVSPGLASPCHRGEEPMEEESAPPDDTATNCTGISFQRAACEASLDDNESILLNLNQVEGEGDKLACQAVIWLWTVCSQSVFQGVEL